MTGKPKTKALLRKEKIKQETEKMNQRKQKLNDALSNPDLLEIVPLFKNFNKNGLQAAVKYFQGCPAELKDWVFDLTERNMKEMYEQTWGWNPNKKKHELYDENARFLVAFDGETPIGFAHIRFELEENMLRIYLFEFQIEATYQKKGLGRFLMQAVEFIGLKTGMEGIFLTVFHINESAYSFYTKMNYKPHKMSPSVAAPENVNDYDYEILFKSLVKNA